MTTTKNGKSDSVEVLDATDEIKMGSGDEASNSNKGAPVAIGLDVPSPSPPKVTRKSKRREPWMNSQNNVPFAELRRVLRKSVSAGISRIWPGNRKRKHSSPADE